MRTQTFGVEIEMTGITRKRAIEVIANHFESRFMQVGGRYGTYKTSDKEGRIWKTMFDASIITTKRESGILVNATKEYSVEMVTPILKYKDITELQEIIRKLRKAGAYANGSCGIHIHVGAEKFTPQTLRNIVNIIASKEDILYKALGIPEGRMRYCQKTNEDLIRLINKRKPQTMDELKDIWYGGSLQRRDEHYNSTRYHGLNLHATFTKGTIEFRLFNSTLHAGKVKAYIQFCLAVTHQALTQKRASAKKTISSNERYTFRCWLLRLGLNGEEFKTCRVHFLKHLAGNSAWRYLP